MVVENTKCCVVCGKSCGILRYTENNEWIHHICGLLSENYECTSYSKMNFKRIESDDKNNNPNLNKKFQCNGVSELDIENPDAMQIEFLKEEIIYGLMKERTELIINEGEDEEGEKTWTY